MIVVLFPPTFNRNFNGEVTQIPASFHELCIADELVTECNGDTVEAIRISIYTILKQSRYKHLSLFQLNEVNAVKPIEFIDNLEGGLLNIHFQIPAWTILPDSMEQDETPVSYYCSVRYLVVEQNEEALGL
jgi:hypothetical protein